MLEFKDFFSQEEQRISEALARELDALDENARALVRPAVGAGGKRIRPMLLVLTGKALGCRSEELYSLACAVEFVHNATLMHDDIIDNAGTRRGRPAAHKLFGARRAVLGGDILLSQAMQLGLRQRDLRVMDALAEAVTGTAVGQVREIASLGNPALAYDEYLAIITGKTACLISGACKAGAVKAGAGPAETAAAAEFGLEVGRAFQLVDDALDVAPESEIGKPTGGDLREGKFTPVLGFYLESLTADERAGFASSFADGELGERDIAATVRRMRALGCDEKTRRLADSHLEHARAALLRLPENQFRHGLAKMAEYVVTRTL
jgi:octaprenyl-diphosphate synthase